MAIHHIQWEPIFERLCRRLERRWECTFAIDREILIEVADKTQATLAGLNDTSVPNVAKVAGHVSFWIRKLKPISYAAQSPATGKFLAINEYVGLMVGLGICHEYLDDSRKAFFQDPPSRILRDWVVSFRVNSHSPHSTQIAFELLVCAN